MTIFRNRSNNIHYFVLLFTLFILSVSFPFNNAAFSKEKVKIIKIGTGNKNAIAYPLMSSMCNLFNKKNLHNYKCEVIETGGSKDNLDGIRSGKYDMGVMKADIEYSAYNGVGSYYGKPFRNLRNIFGLHNEYLTIIAKKDSGIRSFSDLKGKRVYIGNKGSGSRVIIDKIFDKNGWNKSSFAIAYENKASKIYNLLCNNKVDAAVYLVGHPNKIFSRTLKKCDTQLINFSRKEIENYVDIFRYFLPSTLNKSYVNQKQKIKTFSSQLLLASSLQLEEEIAYEFTKVIHQYYEELQRNTPILNNSSPFSDNINVIPLHKGTMRYLTNL